MRGNLKAGTKPERRLRSYLHRRGLRFRVNFQIAAMGLQVRPDVVFPRARLAVMIDGCFWHACPIHGTEPVSNAGYWSAKLARNVERDRTVDDALTEAGWTVIRVWEHVTVEEAAAHIDAMLALKGLARTNVRC